MNKLYARLVLWLRRPVLVEIDSTCLAVAKPGDVVILSLSRELTPLMRDAVADSIRNVAKRFPRLEFVVAEGVEVVRTSSGKVR